MERQDTTDELYVLGLVTGLCRQEPREQLLLDDMLLFLQETEFVPVIRRVSLRYAETSGDCLS